MAVGALDADPALAGLALLDRGLTFTEEAHVVHDGGSLSRNGLA